MEDGVPSMGLAIGLFTLVCLRIYPCFPKDKDPTLVRFSSMWEKYFYLCDCELTFERYSKYKVFRVPYSLGPAAASV